MLIAAQAAEARRGHEDALLPSAVPPDATIRRIIAAADGAPATERARFMACGYVAPLLTRPQSAGDGADTAVTRMLERLGDRLRDGIEGP